MDFQSFTIEPMKHTFYNLCKGVLRMTAEEKFAMLTPENKELIIQQIETLKVSQSESQSSPDSLE